MGQKITRSYRKKYDDLYTVEIKNINKKRKRTVAEQHKILCLVQNLIKLSEQYYEQINLIKTVSKADLFVNNSLYENIVHLALGEIFICLQQNYYHSESDLLLNQIKNMIGSYNFIPLMLKYKSEKSYKDKKLNYQSQCPQWAYLLNQRTKQNKKYHRFLNCEYEKIKKYCLQKNYSVKFFRYLISSCHFKAAKLISYSENCEKITTVHQQFCRLNQAKNAIKGDFLTVPLLEQK